MIKFLFILISNLLLLSEFFSQNGSSKTSFVIKKQSEVNGQFFSSDKVKDEIVREMPKQGKDGCNILNFTFSKKATVDFNALGKDYAPSLLIREMPEQRTEKIEYYNYPENKEQKSQKTNSAALLPLTKGMSFVGNPFNVNTPNDNDMAISDSGIVVSVINSSMFIRDTRTTTLGVTKSLALFTGTISKGQVMFDPKVMYDPVENKYVFICLGGFVDTTSRIIVGFSQTDDPKGLWNLYALPGNPLNNNLWSDYPMIAMTKNELFLTLNLLTNNSTWQSGFVETIIWQIDKRKGYAGLSLNTNLHNNIKYNGKPVRYLCPAKGGSKLYGPNMQFVSNRNFASQNDSIWLVNLTDTIGATNNTITVKMLKTDQSYYFPPDGVQPILSQSLASNDARNLGAFYENNKIQYVHNTNNPANNHVSVYYGVINNVSSANPAVNGYILNNDTMDFGYPNISYCGKNSTDHSAIISFDHSSDKIYPGCSAIESDAIGGFSDILRIQNGSTYINLLTSNLERWGDYSGSQRRYNKTGETWLSGYYGTSGGSTYPRAHAAWIAQIFPGDTTNYTLGLKENKTSPISGNVFPNPSSERFTLELNLSKPEYITIQLTDVTGKLISILLRDWVLIHQKSFSFSTNDLKKGIYFLKISGDINTTITKRIVID